MFHHGVDRIVVPVLDFRNIITSHGAEDFLFLPILPSCHDPASRLHLIIFSGLNQDSGLRRRGNVMRGRRSKQQNVAVWFYSLTTKNLSVEGASSGTHSSHTNTVNTTITYIMFYIFVRTPPNDILHRCLSNTRKTTASYSLRLLPCSKNFLSDEVSFSAPIIFCLQTDPRRNKGNL